ncbi:MAG: hypothetical protein HN380_30690 [Victivallales bacterium]|mgnify:CR=1 FL=1|jgi:hypothetical protein|nr:hypothetical protein [Victivallales bacterium]
MRANWTHMVCVLLGTGLAAAERAKPDATVGLEMLCEMAGIPDLTKAEAGMA